MTKIKRIKPGNYGLLFYLIALLSFIASPTTFGFANHLYVPTKLQKNQQNDFLEFYKPSKIKQISQKRNLVYIYAESLERTYFDESLFPGLIKELRHLESVSTSFTQIKSVYGTQWTVAGLTASQCGIPLVTPSHGNSMSGMDAFLPNTICLGDLLSEEGYELSYLSGSSADFAGTEK